VGEDDMKIVFDIDGTLSNLDHRLHFIQPERVGEKKDWDGFFAACERDTPIPQTVELCQDLMLAGHTVEFWTGRREAERDTTVEWLNKHVLTREVCRKGWDHPLYLEKLSRSSAFGGQWADTSSRLKMRKDGDRRPDYISKMEFIDWDHPPDIIFEDRSRVVRTYRELGLTVFQVAEGNF